MTEKELAKEIAEVHSHFNYSPGEKAIVEELKKIVYYLSQNVQQGTVQTRRG